MECPRCHAAALEAQELDGGLSARNCPQCHGNWIEASDYWDWISRRTETLPETVVDSHAPAVAVADNGRAMLCPHCGHILLRYHVASDLSFFLDHCGFCGGVWFDAGEWEALRGRGLHAHVHEIFSEVWQNRVSREEQLLKQAERLTEKYGEETLGEIRRVRSWLAERPDRHELYALLNPDTPL